MAELTLSRPEQISRAGKSKRDKQQTRLVYVLIAGIDDDNFCKPFT
jgi:hypothetical protein